MFSQSGFIASSAPRQFTIDSVMALTFSNINNECVIAHHDIKDNKMGVGKPISPIETALLVDSLVERKKSNSGWVDSRSLYETESLLVWYRQADTSPTSLWFRVGNTPPVEVCAKLPTLIIMRNKHSSETFVFACAGSKRPTADTKIYNAPIFNTSSNGAFCLGSATVPVGLVSTTDMILGTQDAIFNSVFTHSNQANTFSKKHGKTITNVNHVNIWKSFAKRNARPNKTDLTPTNFTLSDIINKMEK